jgi:hypothetical protein
VELKYFDGRLSVVVLVQVDEIKSRKEEETKLVSTLRKVIGNISLLFLDFTL